MNLTSTNERELSTMLPREVIGYLKQRKLIVPPKIFTKIKLEEVTQPKEKQTPMTKLLPQSHLTQQQ
jgi:hypothetical protein